ncbi:MAG TPA: hypothetical protein VNE39_01275 [Planctomycetota bacterium]|nr:hypothetical protein [Planctomycetota bacterium]
MRNIGLLACGFGAPFVGFLVWVGVIPASNGATVVLVVAGWFAAYLLGMRAQRKLFLHKVINDARLQVVEAIHRYQQWLGRLSIAVSDFGVIAKLNGVEREEWARKSSRLRAILYDPDASRPDWQWRLFDNEILFRETRSCIEPLLERHKDYAFKLGGLLADLDQMVMSPLGTAQGISAKVREMSELSAQNLELTCLMTDLRVHLQNRCLSEITGRPIPERTRDPGTPRLVMGNSGQLEIRHS